MPEKKIVGGVKDIELEADKELKRARARADEILLGAKEEADKIAATELSLGKVEAKCEEIIRKAREEADQKLKDSRKEASGIRAAAGSKIEGIVAHIVDIITGVDLR